MAVKVSPAVKQNVYNGTHGNLSVMFAEVPALADGDSVIAASLEAGVKLVEVKILTKGEAVASLTAKATLNEALLGDGIHEPQVGTKLEDVIGTATEVPKGAVSSDAAGYFPSEDVAEKDKCLVLTFAGAAVTEDKIRLAIYTTSVGTI
ncbi:MULTISPECIES: hypothetical protein [Vibrio harveyi group]|uniref:hypothetical protein n=1 Tax=Vibrio harveyi group TaxID=717610 RepID=UPI00038E123C|nr:MULTISPECIES: hypothetical protein [Vibrio harveyi group]EJG1934686.1 hypothetical protein [Vibrio parahaemolyticus]EQM10629.1 hypothetical protein D045_3401 [Vibrio parahaemolyticus VP-NY4]ETT10866.1 hypothetical protein D026_2275 [Vibrio parahaemolyticus 605]EUC23387.1 hypothetical protein D027_3210 [Vibrio parahaemolyticus 861]MCW7954293.1 hypothetical protein [Vibrio parahaemolyticus]